MRADEFRTLLRHQATSVVVVTTMTGAPAGFTATSFTSVSLDPPLVSFNVNRSSSTWPALRRARFIAAHLLGHGQEELARTFATTGVDRFAAPTRWRPGPYGAPLLADTPAWLVCRIVARIPAGDHVLVVARALAGETTDGPRSPLIYHVGRYLTVDDPAGGGPDGDSSTPEDTV